MQQVSINKLLQLDPYLEPFTRQLINRSIYAEDYILDLEAASKQAKYFGLNLIANTWILREWLPSATCVFLLNDACSWQDDDKYKFTSIGDGVWELKLNKSELAHKDKFKLSVHWEGGSGHRIPAYANRVVQDEDTKDYSAQVWAPDTGYKWEHSGKISIDKPLIYEAHVGMSSQNGEVADFNHFRLNVLPHINQAGYNVIQLMGIQEHPYYGSFGYHVSSFFAVSSRFGTPEDFKRLVDEAHLLGISVIIDLVHSHAVKNVNEGLALMDGTDYQYFHGGVKGDHPAWDSRCFNYAKPQVKEFLLSNCRFWLEEYKVDGFRFDGVTSMLYEHHGLGHSFTNYDQYFNNTDEDAIAYLATANKLIHDINPNALTIAEEMSGFPALCWPSDTGGVGFDYRLSMGVPDYWIKLIKEFRDEEWPLSTLLHELTQHRPEEKTINYAESHDQALVGDKTIIFRLIDKYMYSNMSKDNLNIDANRGLALHKMIRLITAATGSGGYLNFMGNEYGHPEWIDFPREGNNWSYHYARRQWSLASDQKLAYSWLGAFDHDMLAVNAGCKDTVKDVHVHQDDLVLSFIKGDNLFVFNFNPVQSFTDYALPSNNTNYKIVLNTDSSSYGGSDRVDSAIIYPSAQLDGRSVIKTYLPARSALVFSRCV